MHVSLVVKVYLVLYYRACPLFVPLLCFILNIHAVESILLDKLLKILHKKVNFASTTYSGKTWFTFLPNIRNSPPLWSSLLKLKNPPTTNWVAKCRDTSLDKSESIPSWKTGLGLGWGGLRAMDQWDFGLPYIINPNCIQGYCSDWDFRVYLDLKFMQGRCLGLSHCMPGYYRLKKLK